VSAAYGRIQALRGVSLEVPAGSVVALLGANGAGKTTTLRVISGLLRPTDGAVFFEGRRIDRLPPEAIVRLGVAHVPEGRQVFADLTVGENLILGAYARRDRRNVPADLERVFELFPVLRERRKQLAGTLSGGEQQMLAIGRALMARPRLLLLDEPSLGLAPMVAREIFRTVRRVNAEGTTVLLVEQDASRALQVAQTAYVLQTGQVVLWGPAAELRQNEAVRRSYLGY
jgi:branched-chain amino acid transport system ATP-binding protein